MKSLREESSILQILRVSLHIMFAFLLALGYFSAVRLGSTSVLLTVLTAVLGLTYLAGTIAENRFFHGKLGGTVGGNIVPARPYLASFWLGTVTLLWVALLLQDLSFIWLMFPLVFLCMHLLRLPAALLAVFTLTSFSILYPAFHLKTVSAGAIIGPSLGALLAVIISLVYRQLHRDSQMHRLTAEKLRATQVELAQKEYEAGRLEERERLAREIHDTLAQGLSSIVLISRAAAASPDSSEVGHQLNVINRVAADNLAEARRFIRNLSSASLTTSLVPALQRLCAETEEQASARGDALHCIFRVNGDTPPSSTNRSETDHDISAAHELPEDVQETLLRVAQGALANVTAHAQAHRAVVTLGLWEQATTLDIYDDGRGFISSPESPFPQSLSTTESTGYGLISLQARATQMGANLTIESTPNEGTVVTLSIPRQQKRQ